MRCLLLVLALGGCNELAPVDTGQPAAEIDDAPRILSVELECQFQVLQSWIAYTHGLNQGARLTLTDERGDELHWLVAGAADPWGRWQQQSAVLLPADGQAREGYSDIPCEALGDTASWKLELLGADAEPLDCVRSSTLSEEGCRPAQEEGGL